MDREVIKNDFSSLGTVFNMGLATLERIHLVLLKINEVSYQASLNPVSAQNAKVNLVKQLFIQGSVLLKPDKIKELQTKVLSLEPSSTIINSSKGMSGAKSGGTLTIYNPTLNRVLDEITLEILSALQEQKVFMPSRADPKHSWGGGD